MGTFRGIKARLKDTSVDLSGTITSETARAFVARLEAARIAFDGIKPHEFMFNPNMTQPIHLTSPAFIDELERGLSKYGYDLHREPAEPNGWWVTWTQREGA